MPRLLPVMLLIALAGCKDCVGAQKDAELLPELNAALKIIEQPDEWETALRRFERDARIYFRPKLANRVARLASQAETAGQPESLCTPTQVGEWIRAHLTRVRAELEGQPTTPVEPVLCGSAPRPLVRGHDTQWNLYGLDLNAPTARLTLARASGDGETDATPFLAIRSPVKAIVDLSSKGLQLTAQDTELLLKMGDRVLSRVPIDDASATFRVTTTESRSTVAAHPTTTATIPADHTLIGGGCRASFTGSGQLLVASYPSSPRGWTCKSKDHITSDPSNIIAYALSVPQARGLITTVATSTSPRGGHVRTLAHLPAGYKVIGGGCRISGASINSGHLLTVMKPGTTSFECEAKDHIIRSQANLQAYAIGIADDAPIEVVRQEVIGVESRHGRASARLTRPDAVLVGGGCTVTQSKDGNLLWASYPRTEERRWICAHKDHRTNTRATPTAFALGLRAIGGL
ncbi:MAG: hypothetical protein AAF449_05715 [Myxococcota bacterium]